MPKTSETAEVDYTSYADKTPTDLQVRFAEWITDKTGFEPSGCKTKQEAYEAGVRLGVALRMQFQASPENREATAARRAERASAAAAPAEDPEMDAQPEKPRRTTKAAAKAAVPAASPAKAAKRASRPAGAAPAPF